MTIESSFEHGETVYNNFLLGYPADGLTQARRRYMDAAPSVKTFCDVVGAAAIAAERSRVVRDVVDTRLDFVNIVNELD